jgi:hypothetical protein
VTRVRAAAVAGLFYPEDPAELRATVDAMLAANLARASTAPRPKALVAPHAGYVYSGPVAATAYATLRPFAHEITRVVLLGPAHRVAFAGIALPSVDAFQTPLGAVPVDTDAFAAVRSLAGVVVDDRPHAAEHSLEVQLPFLQRVLETFSIVPAVVGQCDAAVVGGFVDALWGGDETLIVVSSDLSHYENYASAQAHDRATADAVLAGAGSAVSPRDACGAFPLRGLLASAHEHDVTAALLDLRSSGDTAGPRDRVVGYGAFAFATASGAG